MLLNNTIKSDGTDAVDDILIPDANNSTSNLTLTNATKANVNEILIQLKLTGYWIDRNLYATARFFYQSGFDKHFIGNEQ